MQGLCSEWQLLRRRMSEMMEDDEVEKEDETTFQN
jgi:hypothetical protein